MAAGICAFNEIVTEPLTKENQEAWFVCVKNFLVAQDLWEAIEGTAKPDEDSVSWSRKNAKALHIMQISCMPESFSHIKQVSEAKVAWSILNHIYAKPDEDSLQPPVPPQGLPIQNEDSPEPPVPSHGHPIQNEDSPKPAVPPQGHPIQNEDSPKPPVPPQGLPIQNEDSPKRAVPPQGHPIQNEDSSKPPVSPQAHPIQNEDSSKPPVPPQGHPIQNKDSSEPPVPPQSHPIQNKDSPNLPTPPQETAEGEVDFDVETLYKAICKNNWCDAKEFLQKHPRALTTKLTSSGKTALHVAAQFGQLGIVEELVKLVPEVCLENVDNFGRTPLIAATLSGVTRIVECMVNKNRKTLGIPNQHGGLPVSLALNIGHKEMARYLYFVTPLEDLKPDKGYQGPRLLYYCFYSGEFDIALDLLQRCEALLFALDSNRWGPIEGIAAMPSALSSGSQRMFWKRWIYNCIHIQSTTIVNDVRVDIQRQDQSRRVHGLRLLQRLISYAYNFLGMKEIYELKLLHAQAAQFRSLVCKNVSVLRTSSQQDVVADALFCAAREGNVEFIVEVVKENPEIILLSRTSTKWHTFFFAVAYRQAEVFNLIHGLRFKDSLAYVDASGDSLLHVAGKLAPSSQLNRIPGVALQMQREVQWFKEVESVVPPSVRLLQNSDGKKPYDILIERHRELRKEGEEWMKGTASSCSVVGALIVTIMFAAAFTVPGGNNQESGYPIFLGKDKLFMLFIISDALSLFSSTTSVLIFLGILTSRYLEEDFLKSLPTKLIIGLSSLFLSIATMMIAFSATILIMLEHRQSWALPIIMFASVPVTLFVLLQFPLLVQIVYSTYGSSIFNRNVKPWP